MAKKQSTELMTMPATIVTIASKEEAVKSLKRYQGYKDTITALVTQAAAIKVINDVTHKRKGELVSELSKEAKDLDAYRLQCTLFYRTTTDFINDTLNEIAEPVKALVNQFKSESQTYLVEKARIAKIESDKIEAQKQEALLKQQEEANKIKTERDTTVGYLRKLMQKISDCDTTEQLRTMVTKVQGFVVPEIFAQEMEPLMAGLKAFGNKQNKIIKAREAGQPVDDLLKEKQGIAQQVFGVVLDMTEKADLIAATPSQEMLLVDQQIMDRSNAPVVRSPVSVRKNVKYRLHGTIVDVAKVAPELVMLNPKATDALLDANREEIRAAIEAAEKEDKEYILITGLEFYFDVSVAMAR